MLFESGEMVEILPAYPPEPLPVWVVVAHRPNLSAKMRAFLESLGADGITRVFEYRLISGAEGKSPFWQMLQHVVNHSTFHRGQVVTLLRQLGAAPPKTMDLIGFYRERA